MHDSYQIGHDLGELTQQVVDHEKRISHLEAVLKTLKHWSWRSVVLCAAWGWPVIAWLKGPDIATAIANLLKAALMR